MHACESSQDYPDEAGGGFPLSHRQTWTRSHCIHSPYNSILSLLPVIRSFYHRIFPSFDSTHRSSISLILLQQTPSLQPSLIHPSTMHFATKFVVAAAALAASVSAQLTVNSPVRLGSPKSELRRMITVLTMSRPLSSSASPSSSAGAVARPVDLTSSPLSPVVRPLLLL